METPVETEDHRTFVWDEPPSGPLRPTFGFPPGQEGRAQVVTMGGTGFLRATGTQAQIIDFTQ